MSRIWVSRRRVNDRANEVRPIGDLRLRVMCRYYIPNLIHNTKVNVRVTIPSEQYKRLSEAKERAKRGRQSREWVGTKERSDWGASATTGDQGSEATEGQLWQQSCPQKRWTFFQVRLSLLHRGIILFEPSARKLTSFVSNLLFWF